MNHGFSNIAMIKLSMKSSLQKKLLKAQQDKSL